MNKITLSLILLTIISFGETLPVIIVNTKQSNSSTQISATKINKSKIENSITGNGNISSLLDTNPNIDIEDISKNSETAGEIKPGKISINKAPYYQNNFLIDNISNNSLLDPNLSRVNNPYDVPGNENEIFLDLDLIKEITVYDSNIPVEYGNFTGGVIDAKTIRAKVKPSFKFSFKHTSDKLAKIHVSNKETFEEAKSDNYQPKFDKRFYSMYASSPINDSNSIIFSYSRKESTIPGAYLGNFKDKKRLNQSFFLKGSHYFDDDSILDIVGTFSPYESTHFQEYLKDSMTKIKGGGYSLKAGYEKDFDSWNLTSNLALKHSQNSKDSLNYNKRWIKTNSKSWGPINEKGEEEYSQEGGSGKIEKEQNSINYNLKLSSEDFNTGLFNHKLKMGFSTNYTKGEYKRKENTYYYLEPIINTNLKCLGRTDGCIENEQYFTERRIYKKEKATAGMFASDIYISNKITYDRFEFTPGLRVDYNNYLKNLDLAYRLNGSIKPFKNDKTVIYAGINRYYGKSFLGYKLRQARLPHYDEYRSTYKNNLNNWGTSADKDSTKYIFSNLKTPYTEERSIGIKQDIDFIKLRTNLKYVHRENKDKFSKHKGKYRVYTMPNKITKAYYKPTFFGNEGYSKSEIISLNLGPTKPIELGFLNLGYSFSTSWTHHYSNSVDYDDILDDNEIKDINKVYYNGKFYDKNNLPNSEKPKNYNLHLSMAFEKFKIFNTDTYINLNHIIRYTSSYSDIKPSDSRNTVTYKDKLPNGGIKEYEVRVYEDIDFKKAITLDMQARFNFKIKEKNNLTLVSEITNVFDRVQNVGTDENKYKMGRQIWFNISYRF